MFAGCGTHRGLTGPARMPAAAAPLWPLHLLPSLPPPSLPAHPEETLEISTSVFFRHLSYPKPWDVLGVALTGRRVSSMNIQAQ